MFYPFQTLEDFKTCGSYCKKFEGQLLASFTVIDSDVKQAEQGIEHGLAIGHGMNSCKDLGNQVV